MNRFVLLFLSFASGFGVVHDEAYFLAGGLLVAIYFFDASRLLCFSFFVIGLISSGLDEWSLIHSRASPYAQNLGRHKLETGSVDWGQILPRASRARVGFSEERQRVLQAKSENFKPHSKDRSAYVPPAELSWTERLKRSLFYGESSALGSENWRALSRLGISHLFVVSGLHIGSLFALCFWMGALLCRRFSSKPHWSFLRWGSLVWASLFFIWFPGGVSLYRSLAAALLVLLGGAIYPALHRYPWAERVVLVAFAFLLYKPSFYFSAGYWFSFGCSYVLCRYSLRDRTVENALLSSWRVSVFALLVAHWLGLDVSILSPLWNLIFIPLFLGLLLPLQALIFVAPELLENFNSLLMNGLLDLERITQSIEAYVIGGPATLSLLFVHIALWSWFRLGLWKEIPLSFASLLLWLVISQINFPSARLSVEMLDVGQGDALLIRMQGQKILIDGGEWRRVEEYLRKSRLSKPDVWVLSHFDQDHSGAFLELGSRIQPKELWVPRLDGTRLSRELLSTSRNTISEIQSKGEELCSEDYCFVGVSWPSQLSSYRRPVKNSDSIMNYIYEKRTKELMAVFLGDIGRQGEGRLLKHWREMGIKIPKTGLPLLKAAHHGSKTSSGPKLVDSLRPRSVWFSCGRQNIYDFPHASVLDRFKSWGSTIWRLDATSGVARSWSSPPSSALKYKDRHKEFF